MSTPEIKELTTATMELSRKTMQSFSEFGIKALNDVADYTETVTKANTAFFGNYNANGLSDAYAKMQSEMIKGYSFWTDYLRNLSK